LSTIAWGSDTVRPMRGIACILLVLAACGDDGTPTEAASLMNAMPAVKSAYSKSFKGADGAGATVLGWKVDFVTAGPGTGCKADGIKVVGSVGIYTDQTSGSVAMLTTGDTSIVLDAPPTAPSGGQVANMGILGVANVQGALSITGVGKSPDGNTVTKLEGMVNVAGTDSNGTTVTLSGTFVAPVCGDS
jgi:hypothetical protein